MKKMTVTLFAILALHSTTLFAHEGHNHDGPVSVQAPKGGVIKAIDENYIEVVVKKQNLKIYFYDKELKPAEVAPFKVKAIAEMPRTKKRDEITLVAQAHSFEAQYDAKNIHRYTLLLEVKHPGEDHVDKIKFTIEPKK